ncbi:class I SAM-dependent DNA methyltransferase [Cognataquiflexum rubidum]|uniref:class I SAM-dependent DNA methyltransferase n=1 Tax=Cognataquiflexum rubidum TaxID=2922273 RepID=UPI001F13412A|nr:DNA methyltransferase [Cognataquiflexum rubidum]MCH6235304.1 class I SAM-dependent DNA methyltransferase [Cognataquiflexum rubidum]
MTLSWNEIKSRAISFSKEWFDATNENADAKPFLVEFFNVFGISRKKVSTFEHRVKKLDEKDGYIDLLWKGTILIEMKSRGKDLDLAYVQAKDYTHGLKQHELPKYILISDFERFRLHDMEENKVVEFLLKDLVFNVQHFGYLLGYQKKIYKEQDPANIKAAELMGKLHDRLEEIGYSGHDLEVYLVRILFCLFAEDTTIFDKQQFQEFLEQRTNEDGSDLASRLHEIFEVLNTPRENRFKNIDEQLGAFPYVNGKLFEEKLRMASFDSKMRQALLDCCYIDWSKISPAIFGSMFQSVMNPKERRNLGAHYTSETNILKLIKPLFLDELWAEFESIRNNKNKLPDFHKKISKLKFLDPACGCGNFLVITYRELRLLEIEILRAMNDKGQGFLDVRDIIWLDVDMMHGIEYEEFPARIAEVAMWLIDHQMNMMISNEFGQYFVRLPLKKAAKIVQGNALRINWEDVVPKSQLSYILGNPPFIGKKEQSPEQKFDMGLIFEKGKGTGVLDYVSAWYIKAAKYIQNTKIKVAFVSTNSISQGEQVGYLWGLMFNKFNIKIHFAHRTFSWKNEAKGNAGVHCVIIGFANYDTIDKTIFEYEDIKGEPHEIKAKNINAYLVDGKEILIVTRTKPLCNVPDIIKGSESTDDGHLMLTGKEVSELVENYPDSISFIRPFIGGGDFLNGNVRYCLWLKDVPSSKFRHIPMIMERLERVKKFRLSSSKQRTRHWASFPTLFSEDRQPIKRYLMFPKVSSERRIYIPFAHIEPEYIINNTASFIPEASLFLFGVLQSKMHMVWMRYTCGRLESRIQYSNGIVYNNFPWPLSPSEKQINTIEAAAQKVLDARAAYPESSLAELYDPWSMPPVLVRAHQELDRAVDLAYRPQAFISDAKRMEFLFELYEKYTADLFTKVKVKKN